MKTIYLDKECRCYVSEAESTIQSVETDFFDGKCDAYIKGYRFVPQGKTWVREDGAEFTGEMVTPWKPYAELDAAQREYEKKLLAEYAAALQVMGVNV